MTTTNTTSRRVALITGANKGIGLEIARQLAQADIRTIIGARSPERGEAAVNDLSSQGLDVTYVQLDTSDEASIVSAAATISEQHGRLDILVNNAGIANWNDGVPSRASLTAVREVLETNFVGMLAVTQVMLPLLLKSTPARIVNLSSALGSLTMNSDPTSPYYSAQLIGYNASKAAVNMLTVQLHAELHGSGIIVNSVSPGFVKTDLTGGAGNMTPAEGAATPVRVALADDAVSGRAVGPEGELPW
jgi:NAD(P)-dependent dehydrogenase (short-subunit alcohol dehydrogenase family)